jgi:hypothetical protein
VEVPDVAVPERAGVSTNLEVASGVVVHADDTVSVPELDEATVRTCDAPVPAVIVRVYPANSFVAPIRDESVKDVDVHEVAVPLSASGGAVSVYFEVESGVVVQAEDTVSVPALNALTLRTCTEPVPEIIVSV